MLQAGQVIGHFELVSPLGRGGMGEVWRARDLKLGREIAFKTLPEHLVNDPEIVLRFEREARALAALNHPHVAQIHEVGEGVLAGAPGPVRFLVMELVEGQSLAAKLRGGALPLDEALRLAQQVAAALGAAHERGVVHRDLKPANVVVTPEGSAKVLDFGLARFQPGRGQVGDAEVTQKLSDANAVIGTVAYMAPEQLRGEECDAACDVWALGCCLAEMISGRRLFQGTTIPEIAALVLAGDVAWNDLPASLDRNVRRLIEACLRLEKRARPTTAEVAGQLAAVIGRRATAGRRRLASAVAAAAVVLIGGLAVLALRGRGAVAPPHVGPARLGVSVESLRAGSGVGDALSRRAEALVVGALAAAGDLKVVERGEAVVRVTGDAVADGSRWLVHLQATDAGSAAVVASVEESFADSDSEAGLARAGLRLAEALQREHLCREMEAEDPYFGFLARRTQNLAAVRAFREGIEMSARARYRESSELFEKVLVADPKFWPSRLTLALNHKATGHFAEARRDIAAARALVPQPSPAEAVALEQAEAHVAEDNQRTLEALERARTMFPGSGYITFRTATAYRLQDRPQEAIPLLEELLAAGWRPDWSPVREVLAHCQLLAGRLDAALATTVEGEKRFPTRFRYPYFAALALQQQGREDAAREALKRAIRKYADYAATDPLVIRETAQYWASQLRWAEEKTAQWREVLKEADARLAADAGDETSRIARANALAGLGRPAEALAALPTPADAYLASQALLARARAEIALGDRGAARATLERAGELWRRGGFPAVGTLAYNIAAVWSTLGDVGEARDWLLRARDQYGIDALDLAMDPDLDPLRAAGGLDAFRGRPGS